MSDRWWLDPAAPEMWKDIPAHYLSTEAFSVRLLRLIVRHERAGVPPEQTLRLLRGHLEELTADLFPPQEGKDDGR